MYKIAICEDDKNYISYLKKIIVTAGIVEKESLLFYDFYSGEQMLFHEECDFDLVIMDIQMEKIDGYETAIKLKEKGCNFLLVFCSGVVQPSPISFKASPFRYLLKNSTDDEMKEEMQVILKEMEHRKEQPYVMCKYSSSGKNQIRVAAEDILYIAIRNEGTQIFPYGKLKEIYPNETLRSNMDMKTISNAFNEKYGFVRAHNSYIINMAHIVEVKSNIVKLADGTQLNVSRARAKEFQMAFTKFMAAKYKG